MSYVKQASDFSYSLSLWGYNEFAYARRGMENDFFAVRGFKILAFEAGYAATTLIGIVETVFWSAIVLVTKLLHFFVPESKNEWFIEHVFEPIFMQAAGCFQGLAGSYAMLLYNFADKETSSQIVENVHNNWVTILTKFKPFVFYSIF